MMQARAWFSARPLARPGRARRPVAALLSLWLLALAACGGVESGGTGTFASGPITGFGSVIVNDIVFDDSTAAVEDADGERRSSTDLRLGMTVEVEGEAPQAGRSRAARIRFASVLVGPVERVDAASFMLFGQRVAVDANTVFDTGLAGGLAALQVGQVVEVYGLLDAGSAAGYRATRVEPRGAVIAYRTFGLVDALNTSLRTLRIGGTQFSYATAANVPANLAVGQPVRLTTAVTPDGSGRFVVLRFGEAQRDGDHEGASLKGVVTQFSSGTEFRVGGRLVDARGAQVSGGEVALGARVEVQGALLGGVMRATRIEVRTEDEERERGFELRGSIESVAGDRSSFLLRGITVGTTSPALRYENGDASSLVVGRNVAVKGQLTPNRAGVEAKQIRFE